MNDGNISYSLSRRAYLAGGLATMGANISGCLESNPANTDSSSISAVNGSFFMLYDLARQVAGDQLLVEDLVPTGSHGDDWEPSPGIIEDIANADVFVYISGFRTWSDDIAATLPDDYPDVVVIDAAEGIEYIEGETGRDVDPHFWLDPLLTQEAVKNIRDGFADADPEHAAGYEENADDFLDQLTNVHEQYEEAMNHRRTDVIVIGSHDSFQYWTERYDLDIYSPVGISPDGQPTAQELAEITDIVEENDLEYVLYDKYEPKDYAQSIAAETNTDLLPLSPIEATTQEQLEADMGYIEHMLEINLHTLEAALDVEYSD